MVGPDGYVWVGVGGSVDDFAWGEDVLEGGWLELAGGWLVLAGGWLVLAAGGWLVLAAGGWLDGSAAVPALQSRHWITIAMNVAIAPLSRDNPPKPPCLVTMGIFSHEAQPWGSSDFTFESAF